jgi:glycerol-3-phosphate O-acyltransferase / dihydroxyacetone phosphate acyltransferase
MAKTRISYRVLQAWARSAVSIFYRRIEVTGAARVPSDQPAILAANHGNALGDVALIIAKMPAFPHFLAAASWWKSPPVRLLFHLGGVVPIHRRRDGGGASQNTSSFAACHAALADGVHIAIFPEGEMHLEPSLLPLKTGAARIALGAADEAGVRGITIVPVGLVYDDRGRFRSDTEIHYGAPIAIDDHLDAYRADPTATVRAVTDLLAERLAAVTVNHASADVAALIDRAAALALVDEPGGRPDDTHSFALRNALRRALVADGDRDELRELAAAVHAHERDLDALGLHGHVATVPVVLAEPATATNRQQAAVVALAPLAGVGVLANAPVLLGAWAAGRRIRGDAWQATAKGVTGTFLVPLTWGLEYGWLARRLGRRPALALTATGAVGGLAFLAWQQRRDQLQRARRVARAEARQPAAFAAAQASRVAVRKRVEAIVGPAAAP